MPKEITLTHIIPKRRKKHLLAFVGGQHSQIKAFFFRLPCFWQPEASVLRGSPWMTTTLKFIGRLSSGNVWFVLPHKSCWKHGIYQFRCHSDAIAAQLRDLQFSALFAVCKVSVTEWRLHPSVLPATINQGRIMKLPCCPAPLSHTVITVQCGEQKARSLSFPPPPPPNLETEVSLGLDRFLCKQIVCGKRWKKSPAWSGFHNPDENKRAWRAV